MENIKCLFIGGSGHSGTTMLANIFRKHTESFGTNGESRVIESLNILEKEYKSIPNSEKIKFTADTLFYGYRFKKEKYQYEKKRENPLFFDELTQTEPVSYIDDLNEVIKQNALYNKKQLFVEKTPSNVYHINQIFELIDNSKVLIIQRDVRDVVASLKSRYLTLVNNQEVFKHNYNTKKLDKDYNLIIDSLMWNKGVQSWSNVSSKNLKIVKYEEFVSDPVNQTKSICEWLGIEFQSEMLDLSARNSSDQNQVKEKGVTGSSIKKYKSNLKLEEIALIQHISGKEMRKMNYELENIPFKVKVKLFYLYPKELMKIPVRVYKRFRLMNFSYFINFSQRVVKKLLIK